MSKKRRTPEGRENGNGNSNPTPNNTADQQETKVGLKEKAKAAGSKAVGGIKSLGGKIWDNRGKIGLIAGVATAALVGMAGKKRGSSEDPDNEFDECPDEIEQPEPDEETTDAEAADE